MNRRTLLPLILAVAALLPAGCNSNPPEQWLRREAPMVSRRVLWVVVETAMVKNGFPVLADEFEPKTRQAHSGWRLDLHPFKGHGYRERAVVGYALGEDARLVLRVRVEREVNENLAKPLDPALAEWRADGDDPEKAEVLLQTILSTLATRR